MPLSEIRQVSAHARLGLWRMDERPDELLALFPHLRLLPMPFKNEGRQKEFLAVRALLAVMTGDDSLVIGHEPSGKPMLPGWNISISHTKGYAALMLSPSTTLQGKDSIVGEPVAVDIEQRSARVDGIASRFIRPDEEAPDTDRKLIIWSAKEALYKLHSEDNLQFFEMRVKEWHPHHLIIENMKSGQLVTLHHELTADYVLVYYLPSSR